MAQVSFWAGALCSLSFLLLVVHSLEPHEEASRVKMPISNPEIQKAVALAVKSYNTQSGSENYFKKLDVLSAERQAVEGIKYFLTIVLVKTNCKKRKAYTLPEGKLEKCEISPDAEQQKQTCEFEIWMNDKKTSSGIQPWKRQGWHCD